MMRCPGCSKHCCENAPRCKYGRAYFAKQQKQEKKAKVKHRWETKVDSGGLVWKLLTVNRKVKKALCKEVITEERLLVSLTRGEKEALSMILDRLEAAVISEKD